MVKLMWNGKWLLNNINNININNMNLFIFRLWGGIRKKKVAKTAKNCFHLI